MTQEESGDENNVKRGSYSYTDPDGVTRVVSYVADAEGFHVKVETNEPGTKTSYPADAEIVSTAPDTTGSDAPAPAPARAPAPKPAVAKPVAVLHTPVHVVSAVQAANPYTIHAAPISYATVHKTAPVTLTLSHAPLTYTLGRSG